MIWHYSRQFGDGSFRQIFIVSGVFFWTCGTTHFLAIWSTWQPVYWLDAGVKAAAALVSVAIAVLLWPLIPQALRVSGRVPLNAIDDQREGKIAKPRRAEEEAADLYGELENRTADLEYINRHLRQRL